MRQKLLKKEKCEKRSEDTVRQEEDNWQVMELIRGAAGHGPGSTLSQHVDMGNHLHSCGCDIREYFHPKQVRVANF